MGNLLGEPFKPYVLNEIKLRQKIFGSGLNNSLRTTEQINYLNNRNAWIKLASSVSVIDSIRLKNIGLSEESSNYENSELAKNAVLFNGMSKVNPTTYKKDNTVDQIGSYNFRSGISTSNSLFSNTSAYGVGGTNQGLSPMPGIQSLSIDCINRGSIRKATVQLTAYNKFQFELIELLYLRLGYTMILEWGWDKFINPKTKKLESLSNTLIEDFWFNPTDISQSAVLNKLEETRLRYNGNYDGFFGKVRNFSWSFNPDGSYSITLDLITVGDVIESLKANGNTNTTKIDTTELPEEYKKLKTTPLVETSNNSYLNQWLFSLIPEIEWSKQYQSDYGYLMDGYDSTNGTTTTKTISTNGEVINTSTTKNKKYTPLTTPPPPQYKYFITFKRLLEEIQNKIIPVIAKNSDNSSLGEPLLYIDTDPNTNVMKVVYNQISIDPRICLIRPYTYLYGVTDKGYSTNFKKLKEFIYPVPGSETDYYGKIFNIYLNLDFIVKCLNSNLDKEGNLSIFKFLESICDGVNTSFGNISNLTPIIKEDKTITIIDENPIPGLNAETPNTLEVYGYNLSNNTSNFVKNISLNTKITPKLSTQISIGATADGTNVRDIEGTAFQKWNKGLQDRFSIQISDRDNSLDYLQQLEEYTQQQKLLRDKLTNVWREQRNNLKDEITDVVVGVSQYLPNIYGYTLQKYKSGDLTPKTFNYGGYFYQSKNLPEFLELAIPRERANKLAVPPSSKVEPKNWYEYLEQAYVANFADSFYPSCNPTYISQGKDLFKQYINNVYTNDFKTNGSSSGNIGFIPIELDLTLDGISGVRIYQQLKINQNFLPSNYNTALNFLIKTVNHKIENNSWETTLGTLSTSNIENQSKLELPQNQPLTPTTEEETKIRYNIETLHISLKGKNHIKKFEAFRNKAYDDLDPNINLTSTTPIKGTLTIGYGFTSAALGREIKWNDVMPQRVADDIFNRTIVNYEQIVKNTIKVPLTQGEFDALVSIVYNAGSIGNTSSGKSTPLKSTLNAGDYISASLIIPEYRITSGGKIFQGLQRRRKLEQDLFLS